MACLGFVGCFHSALQGGRESLSSQLSLLSFGGICPLKHPALCSPPESHVLVSVCAPCLFLSSESLFSPSHEH